MANMRVENDNIKIALSVGDEAVALRILERRKDRREARERAQRRGFPADMDKISMIKELKKAYTSLDLEDAKHLAEVIRGDYHE